MVIFERDRVAEAWRRFFGESLEDGLRRVSTILRRASVMSDFLDGAEGDVPHADYATTTTMSDGDFARLAVLAMVGIRELDPGDEAGLGLALPAPKETD